MAILRNRRKLATVSRETPEGSRSSRAQNVLDPELTQDYISQVSEKIEGRVTKKLSKELSKTESRILGALPKLDEFLLNPQVRTCSVAVPGTSRNTDLENRKTTGDRSSDDPHPEVGYFSQHSGQINSPETETNPHSYQLLAYTFSFSIAKMSVVVKKIRVFRCVRCFFLRQELSRFRRCWKKEIISYTSSKCSVTTLLITYKTKIFSEKNWKTM